MYHGERFMYTVSQKTTTLHFFLCYGPIAAQCWITSRDLSSHTTVRILLASQQKAYWTNVAGTGWILTNKIQHMGEKMQFLCFRVLPGSAETQIRWGRKLFSRQYLRPKLSNRLIRVEVTACHISIIFETQFIRFAVGEVCTPMYIYLYRFT